MRHITFFLLLTLIFIGCGVKQNTSSSEPTPTPVVAEPVTETTKEQPIRSKSALVVPKSNQFDSTKVVATPIDLANPPKGPVTNTTVPKKKKSN